MAIQNLYPTIKPSLNLDFANTKTLDPRIDFTRASTATYYDGKTVAKAEENLLLNSQAPLGLGWYSIDGRIGATEAEVLVNGDFSNGLEGWSQLEEAVLSIESEKLRIEGTGVSNFHGVRYGYAIPSGTYQIQLDASIFAGNGVVKGFTGWTGGTELFVFGLKSGLNTFSITTSSSFYLWIQANNSISFSALIDNVSVKPLYADNKISPDGTATAATFLAVSGSAALYQDIAANAGDYTFSVWLRRVTGSGNVDITAGLSGGWVTQTLTESWARFTVTQTLTAGSRAPGIRLTAEGDIIEVWGAQLEQRSQVTAYTPTTTQRITNYIPVLRTASANVPRFDHNPVTGESLGLLIEESRTNLLPRSEEFISPWSIQGATVVNNAAVALDGSQTAALLVANLGYAYNDGGARVLSQFIRLTGGTTYTWSIYAKAAGVGSLAIRNNWTGGITEYNLTDELTTANKQFIGNGWYRCFVTYTPSSTSTNGFSWRPFVSGGAADGYSGIYIWGAQLEVGSFPTSYIKTEASQVTRSADNAVMTGANFSSWFRQDEGSFCAEFSVNALRQAMIFSSEHRGIGIQTGGQIQVGVYNTGDHTIPQAIVTAVGNPYKVALVHDSKEMGGYGYSGSFVSGKSRNYIVPTSTSLVLGSQGLQRWLNGHIRKIAYYPRRLTNTQLQALTS